MGNKKQPPKIRKFIVEADTVDKEGNALSDESYSTGGAREANGRKISEYRNPVPYDPEDADGHEFYSGPHSEYAAQRRQDERDEQAAHDQRVRDNVDFGLHLFNKYVIPGAKAYWERRGRDDAKRFGGWIAKPFHRGGRNSAVEPSADETTAPVVEPTSDAPVETIEIPEGIASIDDYRNRRCAVSEESESTNIGDDATA